LKQSGRFFNLGKLLGAVSKEEAKACCCLLLNLRPKLYVHKQKSLGELHYKMRAHKRRSSEREISRILRVSAIQHKNLKVISLIWNTPGFGPQWYIFSCNIKCVPLAATAALLQSQHFLQVHNTGENTR